MFIFQFALIFEKKLGRGRSLAQVVTSPGIKVVEEISKTRMIPKGTDALSPAL
jgi:glutamate synthase domain-containing protein 2